MNYSFVFLDDIRSYMVSLVLLLVLIVYMFSGAHDKVLNKFGLSQRDNTLINMGLFIAGALRSLFSLIESFSAGRPDLFLLVHIGIMWLFVTLSYRRL